MERPIILKRKDLELIKDIACQNYKYKASLYITIIEALEEYLVRYKKISPNFEIDLSDFDRTKI